jgi:hypothetical protein
MRQVGVFYSVIAKPGSYSEHFIIGYVKTFIILPSTIYGIATGPLFDAGISNPHSIQIPMLIKTSLDRGVAGVISVTRW